MTRNLYHPTTDRNVAQNRSRLIKTQQVPGAFKWWTPGCDETDDDQAADGCTGDEPALQNNFAQPSPPLEKFAFRLHSDGSLEFKGHLNAENASSGDVAVTLPGANAGEVDFRPANDQYFITAITEDDGSSFTTALVFIDATTGEVTITWPAT